LSTFQEKFERGEKEEKTRVNKLRHTVYIYIHTKKKTANGFLGPSNIHALGGTIEKKNRAGEGRGKMSNWIQTKCFLFDDSKI
jgi:hypothetical protein